MLSRGRPQPLACYGSVSMADMYQHTGWTTYRTKAGVTLDPIFYFRGL